MNQFFSKVTADYWASKNKLQEEAKQVAREMERQIIPEDGLPAFTNTIRLRIDMLNKKHNRCKPLVFYTWTPIKETLDQVFMIDNVFHLELYLVKNEQ
jgi:hypothetical protein